MNSRRFGKRFARGNILDNSSMAFMKIYYFKSNFFKSCYLKEDIDSSLPMAQISIERYTQRQLSHKICLIKTI